MLTKFYVPEEVDFTKNDFDDVLARNSLQLKECEAAAKANNTIVGRLVIEPIADGNAVYQIVKELKSKVKIKLCTGLGDDWSIPYWGDEATIDKSYAMNNIARQDFLESLKNKKRS